MPPKFVRGRSGQGRPLLDQADDYSDEEDIHFDRVELGRKHHSSSHNSVQQGDNVVTRVQGQVSDVMDVMRDNIGKVLQRGEKLDDLEEKSDHLVAGATEFRRSSHKMQKQMWWQSCKIKLCLVGVVVLIILVILVPIIVKFANSNQNPH